MYHAHHRALILAETEEITCLDVNDTRLDVNGNLEYTGSMKTVAVCVFHSVISEFIHGAPEGHPDGPGDCRFPLKYHKPTDEQYVHPEAVADLSPVVTIHDIKGNLVPRNAKCTKCSKWGTDVSTRYCNFKYCGKSRFGDPDPVCDVCWGVEACFTCSKRGCRCRFNACSKQGCTHLMCRCSNFDGWKVGDSGKPPGCARYVRPDGDDDWRGQEPDFFCPECAPAGAVTDRNR